MACQTVQHAIWATSSQLQVCRFASGVLQVRFSTAPLQSPMFLACPVILEPSRAALVHPSAASAAEVIISQRFLDCYASLVSLEPT